MINFLKENSLGKKIAGFFLLAIGLVLLIFLVKVAAKDLPIWFFGRSVTGVVEEKWYELIEENKGEMSFTYYLRYSFTTPEGELVEGNSSLSAQEWMAHVEGREIKIVYSPINPSNSRVDDSRFVPLLLCSYVPFILITWFTLLAGWNILSGEFKKINTLPWEAKKT